MTQSAYGVIISGWSSDVCASDLLEIVEHRLVRLMGISGEDVEGSRHFGIDTGKRDQFFISAAQLVFPSYCLDQRCRGGCDQLQGIDWNGHRPARPTKAAELGT